MKTLAKSEWTLLLIWSLAIIFKLYSDSLFGEEGRTLQLAIIFVVLFAAIMTAAFSVVRHADALAEMLGEPLGTLILTLSVIIIEVSIISAVMLTGEDSPAMARNTMFSIIMIVMNGLVGIALLFGGFRHREQSYNLQGTNTFLAIIMPLAIIGLVLPNYTHTLHEPSFSKPQSIIVGLSTLALYAVFLTVQTVRHRGYFDNPYEGGNLETETTDLQAEQGRRRLLLRHTLLLVAYLVPVVMLAKSIAMPVEYGIRILGLPESLGGFVIAVLVLSPEALGAMEAALKNQLQRAINIFLGSVAATIGLTIPAVLMISVITGEPLLLGLHTEDSLLLATTLAVSMITYNSGRTNILLGAVHLVLFTTYIMLIFDDVYA